LAEFIGEAQEQDLLRRVAARDRRAIGELIEAFEPLVAGVAHRHAAGVPLNDLLQAGNVALLKAVPAYDPDKGRFASYAKKRVEGAIKREAGRLAAKELTGLADDVAVLAQDDLSDQDGPVVRRRRTRRVVFDESETAQQVARDPYLEHHKTDFIDAYHLLAGWLLEEEHDQEIDWESWDYFVRHESALLRAIEQGDKSALAQLAQKYLDLPRRPSGDSHQAKEQRLAPDRRSQVLAAMVAHAVEAGTVAERLARARGRTSGAGPGFWEVRRFRELYLPDGLLVPEGVVPWVEEQAAREGRPATAYLRLPCHDADLADVITGSQEAYAAWLVCEAERLRGANAAELPSSLADVPRALVYGSREHSQLVRIRGDGVLAALKEVTTLLLGHFEGWREQEAVAFILAGVAPPLDKLRARTRHGLYRAASRITIDCDPRSTPAELAAFYERLRRRYLKGRDRLMEPRGLALALFVEERWSAQIPWPQLLELWNQTHPDGDDLHCRVSANQFATECRIAWERISGEVWPGGKRAKAKLQEDVAALLARRARRAAAESPVLGADQQPT